MSTNYFFIRILCSLSINLADSLPDSVLFDMKEEKASEPTYSNSERTHVDERHDSRAVAVADSSSSRTIDSSDRQK